MAARATDRRRSSAPQGLLLSWRSENNFRDAKTGSIPVFHFTRHRMLRRISKRPVAFAVQLLARATNFYRYLPIEHRTKPIDVQRSCDCFALQECKRVATLRAAPVPEIHQAGRRCS